ncbi:MAG: hypothetical protein KKB13_20840 [Chloroflexi bacterium]|nr:hypothetical protein [Chloroflexota bacterium]
MTAAISYQGRLTDPTTGAPLSGTYDLEFTLWSLSGGGVQVGPTTTRNGQIIANGLYSTDIIVDHELVHGQELWLRIRVRETGVGTWETLIPRVQVLPTMYAMSLRPGAQIQGEPPTSDGAVLRVEMDGFYTNGNAVWGTSPATGYGVRGESTNGYGVYGYSSSTWGVWGHSDDSWGGHFTSNEGDGIVVDTNGTAIYDHAGRFTANWGWGVYATSEHNQALRGEAGDVTDKSMPGGAWGVVGIGQSGGTWGSSWNNWGVYGDSHNYRGVQGNTDRTDRNYGLHTYDNLYSLNYHLAGAIMNVAQNGGGEALEPGDVVVFSGMLAPREEVGAPLIQVTKADSANSTAVAGVVYRRINIKALAEDAEPGLEVTSEKPAQPGEYLLLVVQGPAQVKASALAGAIQPGDLLSSAGQQGYAARGAEVIIEGIRTTVPGTVFGKALEPLDKGQKLIYIFVTLQ